ARRAGYQDSDRDHVGADAASDSESSLITASRVGNPACAPSAVVFSAAAALAKRAAAERSSPRAIEAAKAPANASPAPVESTALTGIWSSQSSPSAKSSRFPPGAPMIAAPAPRRRRFAAAFLAAARSVPLLPVSTSA